jgi:hypothetical protein
VHGADRGRLRGVAPAVRPARRTLIDHKRSTKVGRRNAVHRNHVPSAEPCIEGKPRTQRPSRVASLSIAWSSRSIFARAARR